MSFLGVRSVFSGGSENKKNYWAGRVQKYDRSHSEALLCDAMEFSSRVPRFDVGLYSFVRAPNNQTAFNVVEEALRFLPMELRTAFSAHIVKDSRPEVESLRKDLWSVARLSGQREPLFGFSASNRAPYQAQMSSNPAFVGAYVKLQHDLAVLNAVLFKFWQNHALPFKDGELKQFRLALLESCNQYFLEQPQDWKTNNAGKFYYSQQLARTIQAWVKHAESQRCQDTAVFDGDYASELADCAAEISPHLRDMGAATSEISKAVNASTTSFASYMTASVQQESCNELPEYGSVDMYFHGLAEQKRYLATQEKLYIAQQALMNQCLSGAADSVWQKLDDESAAEAWRGQYSAFFNVAAHGTKRNATTAKIEFHKAIDALEFLIARHIELNTAENKLAEIKRKDNAFLDGSEYVRLTGVYFPEGRRRKLSLDEVSTLVNAANKLVAEYPKKSKNLEATFSRMDKGEVTITRAFSIGASKVYSRKEPTIWYQLSKICRGTFGEGIAAYQGQVQECLGLDIDSDVKGILAKAEKCALTKKEEACVNTAFRLIALAKSYIQINDGSHRPNDHAAIPPSLALTLLENLEAKLTVREKSLDRKLSILQWGVVAKDRRESVAFLKSQYLNVLLGLQRYMQENKDALQAETSHADMILEVAALHGVYAKLPTLQVPRLHLGSVWTRWLRTTAQKLGEKMVKDMKHVVDFDPAMLPARKRLEAY